jgi:hypothetical protein
VDRCVRVEMWGTKTAPDLDRGGQWRKSHSDAPK